VPKPLTIPNAIVNAGKVQVRTLQLCFTMISPAGSCIQVRQQDELTCIRAIRPATARKHVDAIVDNPFRSRTDVTDWEGHDAFPAGLVLEGSERAIGVSCAQ